MMRTTLEARHAAVAVTGRAACSARLEEMQGFLELAGGGHQPLSLQALPNCSSAFSHAPVFSEATSAWRTEDGQISGTKVLQKPQISGAKVLENLETSVRLGRLLEVLHLHIPHT